ncbi:MAG: lipid-A-disaccharide synthase [Rhizobiaceae bacterium]
MAEKPASGDGGKLVYFVTGERSGDALGADLMQAFRSLAPVVRFAGLGGPAMRELGLESLFDISEISVMGLSAVLGRLPSLLRRVREVADDAIARKPDVLLLIDSPEFCGRVARRVRAINPEIRVVKYVCPSVWAWRPGRAPKMRRYIDHILAILPFEPDVLKELNGPDCTYIGHPLAAQLEKIRLPDRSTPSGRKTLLILPGSRSTEAKLLLPDFKRTLEILAAREPGVRAVLPAVTHLEPMIRAEIENWSVKPEIVSGEEAKQAAFMEADAAIAVSGTVLLELALYGIPCISIYRVDRVMRLFKFLIFGWTGALPNLIADDVIIPERFEEMVRPHWLARHAQALMRAGPHRQAQLDGFAKVRQRLHQDEPSSLVAARTVLKLIGK